MFHDANAPHPPRRALHPRPPDRSGLRLPIQQGSLPVSVPAGLSIGIFGKKALKKGGFGKKGLKKALLFGKKALKKGWGIFGKKALKKGGFGKKGLKKALFSKSKKGQEPNSIAIFV